LRTNYIFKINARNVVEMKKKINYGFLPKNNIKVVETCHNEEGFIIFNFVFSFECPVIPL
jgi:hypothetical protein